MFIRKRERIGWRGKIRTNYQVVRTFRENGKVKQEILCSLDNSPTIQEALTYAKEQEKIWLNARNKPHMLAFEKKMNQEHKKTRYSYEYWRNRVRKLESVVAQMLL